jgi:L-iditol 2-dehydrogenase
MARHMGAHEAIDTAADPVREILAATGGRGVDCAIDCAAKDDTINQAIRVTRNAGRVALTGIHSAAFVSFDVSNMRRKELAIYNVRRSNHESEAARDLLAEKADWFAPLITHRRPLADIAEAFRTVEHYEDGVGKMVVV